MVDFAVCYSTETWFDGEDHPGYLLDFSKALVKKVIEHDSADGFRGATLRAEDYFVSEDV